MDYMAMIENAVGKEWIQSWDRTLAPLHPEESARTRIEGQLKIGIVLSLCASAILLYWNWSFIVVLFCFMVLLFLPPLIRFALDAYAYDARSRSIEESIPDALFQAASFPQGHSMEEILQFLSRETSGALGKEFRQALNGIRKGESVEAALENIQKRNHSIVLHRAISLLRHGYESGADLNALFRQTAEDVLETHAIIRESNASMAIQQYTILGAAILVPGILGAVVSLSQSLDLSGAALFFGESLDESNRALLAQWLAAGTQVYIIEYALIASYFVSLQQGQPKKTVWYAMALVPLSMACYYAIQWAL